MSRESRDVIVTAVSPNLTEEEEKKRLAELAEGFVSIYDQYHSKEKNQTNDKTA